jgi:hypothetical protein
MNGYQRYCCHVHTFISIYVHILQYMAAVTTVRMKAETKAILDDLKIHPRETYDDVVRRLAGLAYDEEPLTSEELDAIRESEEDIRAGRVQSFDEVLEELGDSDHLRKLRKRR